MKKFATTLTLTLTMVLSLLFLPFTVFAGDCQTQKTLVPATDTLPAYHAMVSGKTCNNSSRVAGTISSTCLYNEVGELEYHRVVKGCECNPVPDVTKPGIANIIRGLQHIGETCQREWQVAPGQYHPLYK